MDEQEFRAVAKHFHLKHKTPEEITAELNEVHGQSAPSLETVICWVNEFKCKSSDDAEHVKSSKSIGINEWNEIRRKRLQKLPPSNSGLCDICGMVLSCQVTLRRHRLIHLGHAPHQCQ